MDNTQPDPKTNSDDKIEVSNPNPTPEPTPQPLTPSSQPTPASTPPAPPPTPAFTPAPATPPSPAETPTPEPPKATSEEATPIPVSTPASPSNHPPTKNEPQIAVDLEDDKGEERVANPIDTGQHDMDHSIPPVKQTSNIRGTMIVAAVAALFLGVGFFGGFFGYKYSPKLAKLFSSSADTTASTTNSSDSSTPKSTSSTPSDIASWPIYSNTKYLYSIKYPDTWYSQGTGDAQSKTVQFTSYKSDTTGTASTDGFKVEIVFQDSNGKQLKDWVTANNTAAGTTSATPQEIQVDGKVAYQQTNTAVTKSISTYISRTSQIMIVTYYGPEAKFDEGKALYDKIIGTIKLM